MDQMTNGPMDQWTNAIARVFFSCEVCEVRVDDLPACEKFLGDQGSGTGWIPAYLGICPNH